MKILIHSIINREGYYLVTEVSYEEEKFIAKIWNGDDTLKDRIGVENLMVELEYDELIGIKLIENLSELAPPIIYNDGKLEIRGKVFRKLKVEGDIIIDILLPLRSDCISILQSEIGEVELIEGQMVALDIKGVIFFPINN